MNLLKPNEHEAPLVHILDADIESMNEDELKAFIEKIRELRAVPAKRESAVRKSTNSAKRREKFDIDSLL